MGVDTKSICMFGKHFDSLEHALTHLKDTGIINEEEFEASLECGNVEALINVEYQTESCYSEEGGVLGVKLSNHNFQEMTSIMEIVKKEVGEDCSLQNFVYWY